MGEPTDFGKHFLVDLHGCDAERIRFVEDVRLVTLKAAAESRATMLADHFHQFDPCGVSGIILIAESHISLHTWPEARFVGLDVFTCGEEMEPEVAIDGLAWAFGARHVRIKVLTRGRLPE